MSYNEVKVTPRRNSSISRPSSSPEVRKIQTRSSTASTATTPDTTLTQEAGMDLSKTNVVMATAHAAKFPDVIKRAIGEVPEDESLEALKKKKQVKYPVDATPEAVKAFVTEHSA